MLGYELVAKAAVKELVKDLKGRNGIGDEWDGIDADVKREIQTTWAHIIEEVFLTQVQQRSYRGTKSVRNQDAIATGAAIGINANAALTYTQRIHERLTQRCPRTYTLEWVFQKKTVSVIGNVL